MKKTILRFATVAAVAFTGMAAAQASDDYCKVPMSEWQPTEALEQMLTQKGWEVRRIKQDDGCYEVYAMDEKGHRRETYFNPKTFEIVKDGEDD